MSIETPLCATCLAETGQQIPMDECTTHYEGDEPEHVDGQMIAVDLVATVRVNLTVYFNKGTEVETEEDAKNAALDRAVGGYYLDDLTVLLRSSWDAGPEYTVEDAYPVEL